MSEEPNSKIGKDGEASKIKEKRTKFCIWCLLQQTSPINGDEDFSKKRPAQLNPIFDDTSLTAYRYEHSYYTAYDHFPDNQGVSFLSSEKTQRLLFLETYVKWIILNNMHLCVRFICLLLLGGKKEQERVRQKLKFLLLVHFPNAHLGPVGLKPAVRNSCGFSCGTITRQPPG